MHQHRYIALVSALAASQQQGQLEGALADPPERVVERGPLRLTAAGLKQVWKSPACSPATHLALEQSNAAMEGLPEDVHLLERHLESRERLRSDGRALRHRTVFLRAHDSPLGIRCPRYR